jgi:hypothetical protein
VLPLRALVNLHPALTTSVFGFMRQFFFLSFILQNESPYKKLGKQASQSRDQLHVIITERNGQRLLDCLNYLYEDVYLTGLK